MLVGVDSHSDRPEEVSRLPKLGPDLQIDVAAVAALEPDLVLASLTVPGHEAVIAGLKRAGLPYLAPEPVSLEDVYRNVRLIAQHLGVSERGERLVKEMRKDLSTSHEARFATAPTLLIQWWPKPVIAPGRLSWVNDLVQLAGGHNPLGDEEVKSRPLTDDEVATINPDAIILSWCGVAPDKVRTDVVYRKTAWQEVSAVKHGRIYCVPEADLGRPGPGLVRGFESLRSVVRAVSQDEHREETHENRQLAP